MASVESRVESSGVRGYGSDGFKHKGVRGVGGVQGVQVDIRKFATKLVRVRSYYGVPNGYRAPFRCLFSMDIRLYFPVRRPFQVRAPPPRRRPLRRLNVRVGPDQLIDWEDVRAALHDQDSDDDSVRTSLLEKILRKVIDQRRLRDMRFQSLM